MKWVGVVEKVRQDGEFRRYHIELAGRVGLMPDAHSKQGPS